MTNPEFHKCSCCGYKWKHGQHGGHDCRDIMRLEINRLKESLKQQREEKQMNTVEKEHSQMVSQLAKDGDLIRLSLTGEDCDLWHMATGVMGEAIEAKDHTDRTNLIEELGDVEFYLRGILHAAKLTPSFPEIHKTNLSLFKLLDDLVLVSGAMLDYVKKTVVYKKNYKTEVLREVDKIYHILSAIYLVADIDRDYVLEHNLNKLLKGKNARYSSGNYSDQQAQDRSDKQ